MNDTTHEAGPHGPAADDTSTPASAPQQQPQQAPPAYGPAPMLESEARTIAMLVHILAAVAVVISAGTLAFVVPLVLWLIYRERSALVDFHGKLNLNLQITLLVIVVGGTLLGLATAFLGFLVTLPLMALYGIYALVMSIVTGVRAQRGEYASIPLVIPFIR